MQFNLRSLLSSCIGIIFCLALNTCAEFSNFTDLGNGYQFGYYNNSKLTCNVFYNDSGIIPGVCNYVEWNEKYILARAYKTNKPDQNSILANYLIDRDIYAMDPRQKESKGVIGPLSQDSLNALLHARNIVFQSKRQIDILKKQ
jgi:hypothetical protein